uniref:Uncharacterized protein n=1 Tax=Spermothamnion repens TaxID=31383 RepID=A0A4D6X4G2_9FLOR|nr:hypothetical protein [Spermothamnion repens]
MLFLTNSTEKKNQWIATKSIYLISTHKTYIYKERIKIEIIQAKEYQNNYTAYKLLHSDIHNSIYKFHNFQEIKLDTISKHDDLSHNLYTIYSTKNKNMKIGLEKNDKIIKYNEKIYQLNDNFIVTFSTLIKNNKYMGIMFTSYIRQSNT